MKSRRWPYLALFAVTALLAALPQLATAAVICHAGANLSVPESSEGLYINFATGVSGPTAGSTPGYDFDPYAAVNTTPSGQLRFYWNDMSSGNGGVVSSGDVYAVLVPGDNISASSLFSRAAFAGNTDIWRAGLTAAYLGYRFKNETTNAINYGWVRLTTSPPMGFPLTVIDWCYDDTGAAITIAPALPDTIFIDEFESPPLAAQ